MLTGSKIRGASDQPAICPLCGATLRQARNLRRHLEMLHFGAGKIPPPTDSESPPGENSPSATNPGHRSVSRGSSHQSVPTSPGAAGTPGSDQSATVVVMPSALCQPVMLASPEDPQHSAQQQHQQQQQHTQQHTQQQHTQQHTQQHQQHQEQHHTRTTPPNLAHMLGPPLLPPPSVATSMMTHHHHQQFLRYPGHPADLLGRPDQHILRGVGIYTDTRLPRPDPGGGMGGTEM